MFITIQFPLIDIRRFLSVPTGRLARPNWPIPLPGEDFIRRFGGIKQRPKGGLPNWVGEHEICEARRSISCDTDTQILKKYSMVRAICFRRFYFDGYAVGKLELGILIKSRNRSPITLSGPRSRELITGILTEQVSVLTPTGEYVRCELRHAGKHIAELYRYGSTKFSSYPLTAEAKDWVRACRPMVFIELQASEQLRLRYWEKQVPLNSEHMQLQHQFVPIGSDKVSAWTLMKNASIENISFEKAEAIRRDCRNLRIMLLRLHAERECLKRILLYVENHTISVEPRSPKSDELQYYLNMAIRNIQNLESHALPHMGGDIYALAYQADELAYPGVVNGIVQELRHIRRNILNKVATYLGNQSYLYIESIGTLNMENQETNKYSIKTESGHVTGVGDHVEQSNFAIGQAWQSVQGSVDIQKLAGELESLRKQIATESTEPQHYVTLGEVAAAEQAAKAGDGPKVMEHLQKAGQWALDVAIKIGVPIVVELLKKVLLPS